MIWSSHVTGGHIIACCEEISEKVRGGRQVERKGQQQGPMETITKVAVQRSDN